MSKCAACSGAWHWKRRSIPPNPQPERLEVRADAPRSRPSPSSDANLVQPCPESPEVCSGKCVASAQLHARGCSRLQLEREPGGDEDHAVAGGPDFPVRPSLPVAKLAAEFAIRHNAHAHLVGYQDRGTREPTNNVGESRDGRAR